MSFESKPSGATSERAKRTDAGRRNRSLLIVAAAFLLGLVSGGYLLHDTQPRIPLRIGDCKAKECFRPQEIAGLVASIGIQRMPGAIPGLLMEDDQCLAIKHPSSPEAFHFVLFTKRDIRNIGEISAEDAPALLGCVAMIGELTRTLGVTRYRVYTNGPDRQEITHLHFHIVP
jgi:hypothetical protein